VIHLGSLDLDQLVTDILPNVQHDLMFEHVVHHLVVLGLKQVQDILSGDVEVRIVGDSDL